MTMKTKELKNVTVLGTEYRLIHAEYGLRKLGDQPSYFSVTGEAWEKSSRRRNPDAHGCIHEMIAGVFPELRDLIALHLCDIDGRPMHALENGWFWFSDGNGDGTHLEPVHEPMFSMTPAQRAERYLRAAPGYFGGVTTEAEFKARMSPLTDQWRHQARAAIARHGLGDAE
jgi:hypothetical protein